MTRPSIRTVLAYLLMFACVFAAIVGIVWEIEHWNDPDIHLPAGSEGRR